MLLVFLSCEVDNNGDAIPSGLGDLQFRNTTGERAEKLFQLYDELEYIKRKSAGNFTEARGVRVSAIQGQLAIIQQLRDEEFTRIMQEGGGLK